MIDVADLHRAAEQIWSERYSVKMDALAAAGAAFIHSSDLTASGPDPDYPVYLDGPSLGYGIMLGYLARENE